MITASVLGVIALVLFWTASKLTFYGIRLYNNLVSLDNNAIKASATIEVLLKQRHDELPKLVECCKQYMGHENRTLVDVMAARAGIQKAKETGDTKALAQNETALHSAIGAIFATVEAYPNLKANESFNEIRQRITSLESAISSRRDYYNDAVTVFNTRIDQFPDLLIARRLGYSHKVLLTFAESEKTDADVKGDFK